MLVLLFEKNEEKFNETTSGPAQPTLSEKLVYVGSFGLKFTAARDFLYINIYFTVCVAFHRSPPVICF